MSKKFSELALLIKNLKIALKINNKDGADPVISSVVSDSRRVLPGSLFCCIRGETSDGHDYVPMAMERGAAALLCERPVGSGLPELVVPSAREVMGDIAAAVYDMPSGKLLMAGVTGTNGKTTTTYILRSILQAAGIRTGLLGTIIESDGVKERDADRTTPESCVIQSQLAAMVQNGCRACVMETSSHGLFLGRLKGTLFDIPVFTNLNPEHLDFHKDMENYFQAKRLLFTGYVKPGFSGAANADDVYGRRLLDEFPENLRGFSLNPDFDDGRRTPAARVTEWQTSLNGTKMKIETPGLPALVLNSPLAGAFNVWNVLCAVTAIRGRVDDEAILRGVEAIPQVPGRLERHVLPNGACCFIDFAHTPAALRSLLNTVRKLTPPGGRVISVFGHGGGRYPMNRPELGRAAGELADEVIVTMDNPRHEDPAGIAGAIAGGIEEVHGQYRIILDRREAVYKGLERLSKNDVLVISGKGPEKYLQIGERKIPYNDADTVRSWSGGKDGQDGEPEVLS